MNKISDLKVGDRVAIINDGEFIVLDIGYYYGNISKEQVVFTEHRHVNENGIDWQKTNELNNKQMKELKIEVPQGFEIDKEKSTFGKIVFKEIENKLPMSVEEIPNRNWYIDAIGGIKEIFNCEHINQLSTKERAQAFLALIQLVELRDAYNDDWEADFTDINQMKYTIYTYHNQINTGSASQGNFNLHFKSEQLRDQFAEQFSELIETAKELL